MSILDLFANGGLGKLEADAKDFVTKAEKIVGDVLASNGNVVAAVIALAEDISTIKDEIRDVAQIIADIRALTSGAAPAVVQPAAHATALGIPAPAATVAASPAAAVFAAVEKIIDPFAAKPLAHSVVEPHGGA